MTLDWQAVVVTIVALGAALIVVRRFLPARRRSMPGPGTSGPNRVRSLRDRRQGHARAAGNRSGRTQTTPVVSRRSACLVEGPPPASGPGPSAYP
jgi:hypothetical protein